MDSGTDYHKYSDLLSVLGRGTLRCLGGLALSPIANPRWNCNIGVLGFRSFTWRFRSVTLRIQSDGSDTPPATKDVNT
jgi:hypothetical protein